MPRQSLYKKVAEAAFRRHPNKLNVDFVAGRTHRYEFKELQIARGKSRRGELALGMDMRRSPSMIGIVWFSGTVRAVVIAAVVAVFVELPATAISRPQDRPAPSVPAGRQADGQPKPTPKSRPAALVEYKNLHYGFCFSLPEDWRGYSIVFNRWHGISIGPGSLGGKLVQQGPIIIIRDPRWTSDGPRQDIPIMVFTRDQWRSVQREEINVSAAPYGPGKLGQNRRYVFALPPRYNYGFLPGWKEVAQIMRSNPLRTDCPDHEHHH